MKLSVRPQTYPTPRGVIVNVSGSGRTISASSPLAHHLPTSNQRWLPAHLSSLVVPARTPSRALKHLWRPSSTQSSATAKESTGEQGRRYTWTTTSRSNQSGHTCTTTQSNTSSTIGQGQHRTSAAPQVAANPTLQHSNPHYIPCHTKCHILRAVHI